MDNAVALVQAYLRLNGFLTVTEFPILEAMRRGEGRAGAEIDVVGVRFPGAGVPVTGAGMVRETFHIDPLLAPRGDAIEVLFGQVREDHAELDQTVTDPLVVRAALLRFGCCTLAEVGAVVGTLIRTGEATSPSNKHVRMVVFATGSSPECVPCAVIPLGHVAEVVAAYLRENWEILQSVPLSDPSFGFLAMLEKSWRAARTTKRRDRPSRAPEPQLKL